MKTLEIKSNVKKVAENFLEYFKQNQYNVQNKELEDWIQRYTEAMIINYAYSKGINDNAQITFVNNPDSDISGIADGEKLNDFKITINMNHLYYGKNSCLCIYKKR